MIDKVKESIYNKSHVINRICKVEVHASCMGFIYEIDFVDLDKKGIVLALNPIRICLSRITTQEEITECLNRFDEVYKEMELRR